MHNLDLIQGCGEAASRIVCLGLGPSLQRRHCGAGGCPEKGTELEKCYQGGGSFPALAGVVFLGGWRFLDVPGW